MIWVPWTLRVRVLGSRVQGLLGSKGPFLDKRVSGRAFSVLSRAGYGGYSLHEEYVQDVQGIVQEPEEPHCAGLAVGQAGYLRPV